MRAKYSVIVRTLVALTLSACQETPDPEDAVEVFAACLERHEVVAENVKLTISSDGSVENISLQIVSEDETPYEPAIRLAC